MNKERFKCPLAVHIFFRRGNEVLFQLRQNTSFEGLYGVVAGHLDGGESAIGSAIREIKEEIGVDVNPADLKFATACHAIYGGKEYVQVYLWCDTWMGEIRNMEEDKCAELRFLRMDRLPENVIPYQVQAFEQAMKGVPFYEDGFEL